VAAGTFTELRHRFGALQVLALLDVAGPFVLVAVGERSVPSSLAGVLVATVPIFVQRTGSCYTCSSSGNNTGCG